MKAVVKETSKLVRVSEVYDTPDLKNPLGDFLGYRDVKDNHIYAPDELYLDNDSIEDYEMWEQRRFQIAKDMLPTIQYVNSQVGFRCGKISPDKEVVETAIRFADELIKQLKENKL